MDEGRHSKDVALWRRSRTGPPFSDAVVFTIVGVAAVAKARSSNGSSVERGGVCLWERIRWCTVSLEA